jgi:aminoglycoside phosphotransferase family enzyme
MDPVLQTRRNETNNQIAAIRSRGKAVEKLHQELQAQIDAIHKKASLELNQLIAEKVPFTLLNRPTPHIYVDEHSLG